MPWEPEGGDHAEQLLQEHPDDEQVARTWPRQSGSDDRQVLTAQVVTADAVRAREPAPQEHPADEPPNVDSPPLHDDRHPDQDDERADETRAGFWRRHPFAVALGLFVCAFAAAGGYLYWDYAEHFESTDDSFIAARQFAIQPKVSGYITAVPVTDNQHVASGDVIARIDDRDYRNALAQAQAQVAAAQASIENIDAQITVQQAQINANQAQVDQAQATLVFGQQQAARYQQLAQTGAGSVQTSQQYTSQLHQAGGRA